MALTNTDLSAALVRPALLLFADFVDLPLRYAFAPMPLLVPGGLTDADADCAGFTFDSLDDGVLQIGTVSHGEGGTDTLAVSFSVAPGQEDILAAMDTPALYAGRLFRLWLVLHDGAGTVTAISPSLGYTGFMSVPRQRVDPEAGEWQFTMEVENWLTLFGGAPSRTYLTQKIYDAGDESANASVGNAASVPALTGGGGAMPFDYSQWAQQR
jgi:hypothetical protein